MRAEQAPGNTTSATGLAVPLLLWVALRRYHHLCLSLGSLTVGVKEKGVQRRLFSVSSVQGDAWRYGKVTVQVAEDWQVRQPGDLVLDWCSDALPIQNRAISQIPA